MTRLKYYILFISIIFINNPVNPAEDTIGRVDAQVCLIANSLNCQFIPPANLAISLNINSIIFTFKDIDIIVNNNNLRKDAWGIYFSTPSGGSDEFLCSTQTCENGAIEVTANNQYVVVERPPGTLTNRLKGTVEITFSRFQDGKLPSRFQSLINNAPDGLLYAYVTYDNNVDDGASNKPPLKDGYTFRSQPYLWRGDIGTLINAPEISAYSREDGFVVNIQPPNDLTAVRQNTQSPADGPTQLIPGETGNVSGYLLQFWKARNQDGTQPCSPAGVWQFSPNPFLYNNYSTAITLPAPTLNCTYPVYDEASMGTGGVSDEVGCSFGIPNSPDQEPYLQVQSPIPPLTVLNVPVPWLFEGTVESKVAVMQNLIDNPSQEFSIPGTCQSVVYVPSTQSSYGKTNVENGDVYGVTAWTLNAAYAAIDPTPNISMNHSNIVYMTGGTFTLASKEKTSSLTLKSADCLVATAASGDINSRSVFYWRILRDEYLTKVGFTKFYYRHAASWATWLNEHPKLKPPVNFILEKTGAAFYYTSLYGKKAYSWTKEHTTQLFHTLKNLWVQEASASETYDEWSQPHFDLGISGGVMFPESSDRHLYEEFYPNPTVDFSLTSSGILWTSHVGWSLGLKGDYAFNNSVSIDKTLGSSTQENRRSLSFASLEVIAGVRYRHPNLLFFQPGVYVGGGILRLREEGKAKEDNGLNGAKDKSEILGVTEYSPVFDLGANLDISLADLFLYSERELAYEKDIMLRLSAIYRVNPSRALSMTGIILNAGFAFLF